MIRVFSRVAIAALVLLSLCGVPQTLAADLTDIGMIDQNALASLPSFQAANRRFNDYRGQLQREFAGRAKNARSAADQQKLSGEFQQKLGNRQRELFGPLFAAAQTAIASIASSKNLSVVVDRRIVVVGGQEITRNVVDLLNSPGSPVPPVSTPGNSSVGFVDQSQIDALDSYKKAQTEFAKFGDDQRRSAQDKMRGAKTDADRKKVMDEYSKTIEDKSNTLVKPLVDRTRAAIADVARDQKLVVVIDRANLIFGGKDVTADVVKKLK